MRTKTNYISTALTDLYPSTTISPHPLLIPYQSPSKNTPNTKIRENQCESVSEFLNERTQFCRRKHDLNPCLKTIYITRLSPSPKKTNPLSLFNTKPKREISENSRESVSRDLNPTQTQTEPRPNRIRPRPNPTTLRTSCLSSYTAPPFSNSKPLHFCSKPQKNPSKRAQNCSKLFETASKRTLN